MTTQRECGHGHVISVISKQVVNLEPVHAQWKANLPSVWQHLSLTLNNV